MDSFFLFLALLAVPAVFAGAVLMQSRFHRKNEAGIVTGLASRAVQVGSLFTRGILRKLWLRLRQILASHEHKKELEEQYHLTTAQEAAGVMGNMKGVFMKLGQIASFANDALPEQAQQALRGLQQNAPPMAFSLVRGVVESELQGDLSRFFKDFEEEPLAAASIGQVHKAKLHDGTAVAVKVQYPGVDRAIENDLKATAGLAFLINQINKNTDAQAVVAELKERLLDELDYRKEAANQKLFHELWEGHPLIRIPRVFPEISSKRVLCQEFKRGLGFYDFLKHSTDRERQTAVLVLNDFVFDSMHRFHVFNGDPHPGNYIFHEDGGITFLDYGCVKYFEPGFIGDLLTMNRTLVEGDRETFDKMVLQLKLILPGRPYDRDWMWNFFQYHASPFLKDEDFHFTAEWVAKAREIMDPVQLQQINLPPDLLFFNRITFGLNAIFQKLGARANFHQCYRRYLFESENVPPAVARVGARLPERFLSAAKKPVQRVFLHL